MARILVIDDDEQVLSMMQKMLSRAGHEILAALDGFEGMRICRRTPIDLVITDIIMPDMEGLEVILSLKREFPGVKIIAISGRSFKKPNDYLRIAGKFGANYTLAKPFECREMLMAVRNLMG